METTGLIVVQMDDLLVASYGVARSIEVHREVEDFGFPYPRYVSPWIDLKVDLLAKEVIQTRGNFDDFWDRFRKDGNWAPRPGPDALPAQQRGLP